MLSLYEILKASKTGIAPDMWTALAGKNWGGADSGHEVKELTGIPPLSFTADGTPLLDYLIKGNTVQNGTPTPTTPIQPSECGERTGNLLDWSYFKDGYFLDNATGLPAIYSFSLSRIATTSPIDVSNCNYVTFSFTTNATVPLYIYSLFDGNTLIRRVANNSNGASIDTSEGDKLYLCIYSNSTSITTPNINAAMLNDGSSPLPYEPFGVKTPILCGNQTTNIYLGETQSTRAVKKLVLTGEENWEQQSGQTADYFRISNMDGIPSKVYCTHYISPDDDINYASTVTGIKMQQSSSYGVILACRPPNVTGLANFKSFLATQYAANTPVTVWYVLATPETGVVNEPLMKIGDYADTLSMEQAGVSIPTVSGTNVIDVDTTVKPSEMYIKYQE